MNISIASSVCGSPTAPAAARFRLGFARIAIGLVQALGLLWMYRAWFTTTFPMDAPFVAGPIVLVLLLVPPIFSSSLGQMKPTVALGWAVLFTVIIAALAFHDVWRSYPSLSATAAFTKRKLLAPWPSREMFWAMFAGLFIAHSLLMAGAADRRFIASYSRYFEQSWKLMCQLVLSGLFVFAAWFVLWMGARLLEVVSIGWFVEFVTEPWGHIPIIALAFAIAMHITDQRPSLVLGARTLFLVLFSWLLPVATLMTAGFVLGLPVTGLDTLWLTHDACRLLLLTIALLIVLINAAFQDGTTRTARFIRTSARIASLLLLPLTILAACALYMRVDQYGWSARRIIVAYCLVVAACYTLGYAHTAFQRNNLLPSIPRVNVFTAWIILALILLALSPILDPARLAARLQVARFNTGKVTVEKFDVDYLRYDSARYGTEALREMRARATGKGDKSLYEKVNQALTNTERGLLTFMPTPPADITANLTVWPRSAKLPASFLRIPSKQWDDLINPLCLSHAGERCDVYLLDVTGDAKNELIVVSLSPDGRSVVLQESELGQWKSIGSLYYRIAGCKWLIDAMRSGSFKAVAPLRNDLEIAGQRVVIEHVHSHQDVSCD